MTTSVKCSDLTVTDAQAAYNAAGIVLQAWGAEQDVDKKAALLRVVQGQLRVASAALNCVAGIDGD